MRFFRFHFILLCLSTITFLAQNQNSKWYFGNQAGLDFTTNPPTVLSNGVINSSEGSASMADVAGNLLFYTDGVTIWNQQHLPMFNGTGLLGNSSTTQSSLIIKLPGSSNIYYVFTLDDIGGADGLRYSIVDMSLAGGLGAVTTKNILIYTPSTEKLTAINHCNGTDVWILSHELNSNNFRAYLLTTSGINSNAVISLAGSTAGSGLIGSVKVSPNGNKLAAVSGGVEIFDFDNNSGIVSNSLNLISTPATFFYGCEFSPDGTKIYATRTNVNTIYQWDLCSPSAIIASQYTISTGAFSPKNLQLAPNGKIYVAIPGQQSLGVIQDPNKYGSLCNYSNQAQSIGTATCYLGLPGFNSSAFKTNEPFISTSDSTSACLTASFTAWPCPVATQLNQVAWLFGDPFSGTANTSTLANPIHVYTGPGTYTVQLIRYNNCKNDTLLQTISIGYNAPIMNISGSFSICAGQQTSLTLTGANSYSLNGVPTGSVLNLSPVSSSSYMVSGNNSIGGCISSTTITVNVFPNSIVNIAGNTILCNNQPSTFTASGLSTYSWSNGSNSAVTSITATSGVGAYTLSGEDSNGCIITKTVSLSVYACLDIEENRKNEMVRLYPNPSDGDLTVECTETLQLELYNETGALVLEKTMLAGVNYINISRFNKGIYLCRYFAGGYSGIIKLIKTN